MQGLRLIHSWTRGNSRVYPNDNSGKARPVGDFDMLQSTRAVWDNCARPCGTMRFLARLSVEARIEFQLLATYASCPAMTVLITEGEEPLSIQFLLAGNVNITMTSIGGRQILLGVGRAGDILGLSAVLSGNASEVRVETKFPCRIASMPRNVFLDFLEHYPGASFALMRELSLDYARACERLRTVALAPNVKARLAWLLLDWCKNCDETKSGIHINCTLTHKEIGDYIGSSRETVTRILADFKNRGLVKQDGPNFIVRDQRALASYIDSASLSDPHDPSAA